MRFLARTLFILPLSVHIGYLAATFPHLAGGVGRTAVSDGTPKGEFLLFWCLTIGLANLLFLGLYFSLPRMSDRMLRVPGAAYWLATPERRSELVARLKGIFETALLGLNVFFFAVYQIVYQANTLTPVLSFPPAVLITFFMIAPLLMVLVAGLLITRNIALDAEREKGRPDDG